MAPARDTVLGIVLNLVVFSEFCASFRVTDERDALPIPDGIYRGSCPFQDWYGGNLPDDFDTWQHIQVQKVRDAWNASGSPTGVRLNDHNYETLLGQGNTLGFVAATLTLEGGPEHTRFGLFAHQGTLPAVVRLSDFGQDTMKFPRMTRLALKVPFESAWDGEVNLLFTETLDAFPIDGFRSLAVFAGDERSQARAGAIETIRGQSNLLSGGVLSGLTAAGRAYEASTSETLAHNYYSQLPYALGREQAAKISLVPRQKTCGAAGADDLCCLPSRTQPSSLEEALAFATDRAGVTAEYLSKCDAVFDLKLQVKRYDEATFYVVNNTNLIERRASVSWHEQEITVGSLRIPRQRCTNDVAAGVRLVNELSSELQIPREVIDKAFAFHPVSTHEDNRPVGEVNTFRSAFYSQHAAMRRETMQEGVFDRTEEERPFWQRLRGPWQSSTSLPGGVSRVPFDALRAADIFEAQATPPSLLDLQRPRTLTRRGAQKASSVR